MDNTGDSNSAGEDGDGYTGNANTKSSGNGAVPLGICGIGMILFGLVTRTCRLRS